MQTLSSVLFSSTNKNKYSEAKEILEKFGIRLQFFESNLLEIQADTLEEVAYHKALNAFSKSSKPVIVEDDGLFIDSLNGFPGPFSSFVFKSIGNSGVLKLVKSKRTASFQSVIAFCEKHDDVKLFNAIVEGKISKKPIGKKWGYDPIFIPKGQSTTYSQLNKNLISHRYLALKKFANWYQKNRELNY